MAKKSASTSGLDNEVKKLKEKYGDSFSIHFLPNPFLKLPLSNAEIRDTADMIAESLKKTEAGKLPHVKSL